MGVSTVKLTSISQLAPIASELPQVLVCENDPVVVMREIKSGPFPVFCT